MTQNATGGPTIVYGQKPAQAGTGYIGEYNEDASPSLFYGGTGLLDPRWGYFESGGNPHALGFQGSTYIPVLNAAPTTLSATNIAASQAPTLNTALTLASSSVTGITVLGNALTVYPSLTSVPANSIALDGAPATIIFEKNSSGLGGLQLYDPTKALARNISIRASANDTQYTVKGYDVYGFPMSEIITGTSGTTGGTFAGKKAFKFVASVTPSGSTTNSTSVAVGTGDVYGFPIRADGYGDVAIIYAGANIVSSTGFLAAVTSTATSTTGDVRGTYALQNASNSSSTLQVFVTPRAGNLPVGLTYTGLFGVTQA